MIGVMGGGSRAFPVGCRRRRVTIESSKFADDEHVEEENDERYDEEDGQFGHPRPD